MTTLTEMVHAASATAALHLSEYLPCFSFNAVVSNDISRE
jgi:hypothetical protein